jgi:MoaA/NifB/PqqE/SkfB family radical SAM enzyme
VSSDRLFCSKPFEWFEVSRGGAGGEGDTYLCCPTWVPTAVGNLQQQTVQEVWNGPQAQAIRASILDGSFSYCNGANCPHLQNIDGPVRRVADVSDPLHQAILRDGLTILPWGPRDVNCSYDRSCNLSCPSCRTKIIQESRAKDRIERIQQRINDEALADARLLYITGSGDPFGSPFFRKWLQTMRRADMPTLDRIHLHTNAQLWTPRMWESIPEEIRALVKTADISIDAGQAATYEINRRGGRWDVLLENLAFVRTLRTEGPLEWLGINMCVQANNYREMPAFVALGERFGADTTAFSRINNWGTFTDAEFRSRAVHDPAHPEHDALLDVLADAALERPIVYLGNLLDLREAARARGGMRWQLRRALRGVRRLVPAAGAQGASAAAG